MKEDPGSGNQLRRPFGCLIVKKKDDGMMSNGKSKERKRPKLILSDSDSDPPPPKVVCRGSDVPVVRKCDSDSVERWEENEIDRKRKAGPAVYMEDARIDRSKFVEGGIERKRSRLDDTRLEERRTEIGRNGVLISKTRLPIDRRKEYESDSIRCIPAESGGRSEFGRSNNVSIGREREAIRLDRQIMEMRKDGNTPGLLKPKFEAHHGQPIRVQGKNGVLKMIPRNNNKVGAFSSKREEENIKASGVGASEKFFSPKEEENKKGHVVAASERFFSPKKEEENIKGSGVGASERFFSPKTEESRKGYGVGTSGRFFSPKNEEIRKGHAVGASDRLFSPKKEEESRKVSAVSASDILFSPKKEDHRKASGSADCSNGASPLSPAVYLDNKLREKSHSAAVTEKKHALKRLSIKRKEASDQITQARETALFQETKDVGSCSSKVGSKKKQETLTSEPCTSVRRKDGEAKRGNGTEKQILREQIRQMLVNAGWIIDLRPRKNRDYQDSVYVSPSGTEYWSITKAYYAFQKNFEDEGRDQKHTGDLLSCKLIPEDVLSKLTRQTRKKIEREMKMQQKGGRGSKKAKETYEKKINNKHVKVKMDNTMNGEKMNVNITQDGKSLKVRIKANNVVGPRTDDLAKHKKSTLSKDCYGNGERKNQSGRALLVRNSSQGLNMEDDDFVPYTGKRTVLSWLIDMEAVRLSGKVQYMNKKRTRAMLEGWITRDGIHCRCCSKILTISKFELHAGSKLHHPFQNIIVENGASLYQCQLDAWNRQDKCVRRGFYFIDVDGDDPNDDTCGICGDGGDLICCDGCPSTFHQSCLDIQMLPSGDWLCPNCTCRFCGGVDSCSDNEEDTTLYACSLCEEKFHRRCRPVADITSLGSDSLRFSFCGKACEKLFQQLQKLLGVKHELEAGFSWTLIQRSNLDSDASSRGQCQKAECNSKIAVALTVMDECFLPVIDQRSGVNLIHNVLYNIGSNFNRVNYSGFYTVILERGDEIISAASIRIHGTKLVEMPFIGTRHMYRRQGMFRRLLYVVESVLCSLNVEKLVIPAISELRHTWTTVFGFKPLKESHKQAVKTLNMLVFPSTDLLQKPLLKDKLKEVYVTEYSVGSQIIKEDGKDYTVPERSENTVKRAVGDSKMNNGDSLIETGQLTGVSTHDTSDLTKDPSDASLGTNTNVPSDCSAPDTNVFPHADLNRQNKLDAGVNPTCKSSVESKLQNSTEDDPHAVENELNPLAEIASEDKIANNQDGSVFDTSFGFQHTARTPVQGNSNIEQYVPKVECKADLCSVALGICPPDKGVIYDLNMSGDVASSGTGLEGPVGSTYNTSDMMSKPLDASVGSIPDDHSEESSPATKLLLHHDMKSDVETKSILGSSVKLKLQDTTKADAHELKVEAGCVVLDHYPLGETPAQDTSSMHNYYPNTFSGNSRTAENHVGSSFDLNEDIVHKMECKSQMVSFELGICTGDRSVACDTKVRNGVTSFGTGSSGSTSSDMKGNPADVALKPIPGSLSAESALLPKNPGSCMVHEDKLDAETISSVDSKLQSPTKDDVPEVNVEAASGKHTNTYTSYPNAIYGNLFQCTGQKRAEKSIDLNKDNFHNMGCASIEGCQDTSDAVYFKVHVQSNTGKSTKHDASEVKTATSESDLFPSNKCCMASERTKRDVSEVNTESSAVASDPLPFNEVRAHNQLNVTTVGNNFKGPSKNAVCYEPEGSSKPFGVVSDINYQISGENLVHHRGFQLLQNLHNGSNSATDEATISCEMGNGGVPERHNSQESGKDLVSSTSEVSGVLLNKVELKKLQGSCIC